MYGKNRLFYILLFIISFVLIHYHVTAKHMNTHKPARESSSKTAAYQNLQPDEFITRWLVLGPIPVFKEKTNPEDEKTQKEAFDKEYIELNKFTSITEKQTQKINDKKYTWQFIESKEEIIDLTESYGDTNFVIAYALTEIIMPKTEEVLIGLGSDDGVKVWLNGELVHENWIGRPVNKDDDLFPVKFKKGKNQLLLKVQNMQYEWGFSCRIIGPLLFPEKLNSFAGRGDLEALKMLLSHGADVNAKNKLGLTALYSAKIKGRKEVIDLLLEHNADSKIEMPSEEELLDRIFEQSLMDDSTGTAVLVSQKGKIIYEKGFGYASLEHHVPVTSKTKFRIGSITKQFTASAILKLQEDNLLNMKDPLSKYIPDFPRGNEVTIHHLLTHTSGIHNYTNRPDFREAVTLEMKPEDMIETIKKDTFDFDPGAQYRYSNSGYFILGYIIEKVSGLSYGEFLKKNFFTPAEMFDTGVHQQNVILENEAAGYSYINNRLEKALNWNMSQAGGAGALYSTIIDLFKWNELIFKGKLLSKESIEAAFTPAIFNDGETNLPGGGQYGYGWDINTFRGLKEIGHGGGLAGFVSNIARYPEAEMSIIILRNCSPFKNINPFSLHREIAEIYLWQEMEPQESFTKDTTVSAVIYDDYVGRYEYPGSAVLIVTKEENRLFAQLTGQPRFEIYPRSEKEFFWKVADAQITFVRNEEGRVTHAIHHQGGQEFQVVKIKEKKIADIDPAIYDSYTGEYKLTKNLIITVIKEENQIFIQLTGQPRFEIFPSSETEYFLKVVKAEVTFLKDAKGNITGLILNQGGQEQNAKKIK
jgi:CubicO group peptidase (beta-lactamase class C family)